MVLNMKIMERVRCLISNNANYSAQFWAEAVSIVAYLRNRCVFITVGMKILEEILFGCAPNLEILRVFVCVGLCTYKTGQT